MSLPHIASPRDTVGVAISHSDSHATTASLHQDLSISGMLSSGGSGAFLMSTLRTNIASPNQNALSAIDHNNTASGWFQTLNAPATSPTQHSAATYGDMLGASVHFLLESIIARCRCDRVALFLPHPKYNTLIRVAVVGPTAPAVATQNAATISGGRGDSGSSAGPVTVAVLQTGLAANLSQVAAEDAQDCPGTSVARTALICPVKPFNRPVAASAAIGVIFAVNKNGGSSVFTSDDQLTLVSLAPSIAYLCETYPVDFAAHRFDPASLHKIIPLCRTGVSGQSQTHDAADTDSATKQKKSARMNAQQEQQHQTNQDMKSTAAVVKRNKKVQQQQATLALPEKPPQLVYEQSGQEGMLPYVAVALERRIAEISQQVNSTTNKIQGKEFWNTGVFETPNIPGQSQWQQSEFLTTAQQIVSVGDFVQKMEQCWRDSVSRCIATERELTLRSAQVVDAHSLLHRKQRRVEVLKDVLVETLDRRQVQ